MKHKVDTKKLWIVIPAYNEAHYIERVLKKVSAITKNIVVVDDGSKDSTFELSQIFATYALRHELNLGKGAALKTGCDFAFNELEAEAVIILDSDDQHDPQEAKHFISALQKGAEVVFGERRIGSEMPFVRIFLNRLASFVVWFLFGEYVPDIPSGYKAFSKAGYQLLRWESTGYEVETEIAVRVAKHHIAYTSVPITTIYHDFTRGMTFLDAIIIINKIISWRLWL